MFLRDFINALKNQIRLDRSITADCPTIDPVIVDSVISSAIRKKFDYSCNTIPPTYPDGLDVECFSVKSLKLAFNNSSMKYEKEHVTPYLRFSKKLKKVMLNINMIILI